MQAADDSALLRQYAENNSEAAFAALVARYVNLVHSVALRDVGNSHDAEEITQAVFIILARKAGRLRHHKTLSGWLFEATHLTAHNFVRSEMRRHRREQEAHMQSVLNESGMEGWQQIAPLLDAGVMAMREKERQAILLRFFENRSLREVGRALDASEDAVEKRVSRALEKLRAFFARRGVALSAGAIAGAVSANSVQAAPVALAKSVTAVAVTKGAAASASTLTLIKGALKIMAWAKAKTAIVAGVSVLLVAGTTSVLVVQKESLIDGKTEGEWIASIVYWGDDNQVRLWHSLGQRGVQMLLRAMKPSHAALIYEQALAGHGTVDDKTAKQAIADRATRMSAALLLSQLATKYGEKSAIPDVIKLLKTEKDPSVRAIELGFFETQMQSMSKKQKAAIFPELLHSLNGDDSERNNALVALQYYANQKETVVPLMVRALQDPIPFVRVTAVKALNKIDPQNPVSSNFASILAGCITAPPGNMPDADNEAVIMLGELHRDPDVAVPALIQALQSDKSYVRNNAAAALGRFGSQARAAVPALQKALEDSDASVRKLAATALDRISSEAPEN